MKKLRKEHSRVLVILDEEACRPTLRTPNWVYRGAEIKHYVRAVKPFL